MTLPVYSLVPGSRSLGMRLAYMYYRGDYYGIYQCKIIVKGVVYRVIPGIIIGSFISLFLGYRPSVKSDLLLWIYRANP